MLPRDVYGIWVTSGMVNATTLVFSVCHAVREAGVILREHRVGR